MLNIGPTELIIILLVALIVFGPKNLPRLGSSLGKTIKNIREGIEDDKPAKKQLEENIEYMATSIDVSPVICPSCGTSNDADAGFCKHCGAKLKSSNPAVSADNVQETTE